MKKTIYDVAREANVSIATVSKVINNTGRIGEKTRQRVLQVMKELDYQPSLVAAALTGKSTYSIGLLIPDLANPFFAELARSIEDRGHELGYSIVMCSTDYRPEKESKYISLLKQKSVDGFILASGFQNDAVIRDLLNLKIPIAVLARDVSTVSVDTVTVDDFIGGYNATQHLLDLGHQQIGAIQLDLEVGRERARGYRLALQENGLEYDEKYVLFGPSSVECGKQMGLKMLQAAERPTAIFAGNDLVAIGIIQAARELGLSIPDDVSVVGYDNTILAAISNPPLTTVAQPFHDMGRQVMDLLIEEIKGKKKGKKRVVMLPELCVRESTNQIRK
ncbi:LacI family transcriptional regulator [Brevibacillus ruminantium]|uniref:LacI family transcriptional regulator n=1 Tax=Brevibacillus ruminantium TaxID=2950604 RepID=A0ABY4WLR5_9BACL|nr:LacI family DNA-binding transcriptional regulator [Brevibacillus ruminantium]USG67809.1 LacI family transcriptional regulator [Brevibacillus ruminantium]